MARFTVTGESQAGQLQGTPSGTTFNGYFAALVAGASQNYKLRRVNLGVRNSSGVPTSQQFTVRMYRQTVRVVGTGFTTTVDGNMDPRGAASQITGLDVTTAATAGTTGPTIGASPIGPTITANTQSFEDVPIDLIEELICDQGTANGIAFVNIGQALPSGHLFVLMVEDEQ
jgi:hypothetical protein